MRRTPPWLAVLVCAPWLAACGEDKGPGAPPPAATAAWRTVADKDLDARQAAQMARALAARKAMFDELLETLTKEVQRGGAAGAITVCKERAPAIAEATGRAHGVRIGRTSFRLRNPGNEGPPWVAPLTTDRPESPRFAVGPGGEFGAVLPIKVQTGCLQCHGPEESIAEDVRTRLRAEYPQDRATGFREGDLRGWFWVEVPGSS